MGWFEAGIGMFTDQLNAANQQVQHKVDESQKTLDELAARGAEVEAQIRKTVDPSQLLELWRQSPLHHWMPTFTTPRQKRAMQIEALSAKVDLLVEQVALLAAKQAAAKQAAAKAEEKPQPAAKPKATRAKKTTTTKRTTSTRAAKPATARKAASKDAPAKDE